MREALQLKQKSKKFNKLLLVLVPAMLLAIGVCFYSYITVQVEIFSKSSELSEVTAQLEAVEDSNRQLNRYLKGEYRIEYIESIARDKLGYALPEERVYYIVPSD